MFDINLVHIFIIPQTKQQMSQSLHSISAKLKRCIIYMKKRYLMAYNSVGLSLLRLSTWQTLALVHIVCGKAQTNQGSETHNHFGTIIQILFL